MITLHDLLIYVPDNSRIGVVFKDNNGRLTTLFSGYKGDFIKFCNHKSTFPDNYELTHVYAGLWDNKNGLVIGVKYKD